jgi:predicted DsbA family dithiol-disulfide isomerase
MSTLPDRMRIDAWSDVVCPWCAIGKAHLEQALTGFEHADRVDVVWRSFELDPGAPATREGSYDALLAAKYGSGAAGGRAMVTRLSAAAERAGVQARFDLVRPTNTFDAHRLLHLAKESGLQGALKARLVHAYLAEGALLSDPGVLESLAVDAGVDAAAARRTLGSQEYADRVRADEAEAGRREVTAVPTFLVDGRVVIPGAQSPESMLATLRRAWSRRSA